MGLPIAIALTGGEVSDYKGYMPVMDAEGPAPKVLLADKGYDANFIRDDMQRRGGFAMIPTKKNRLAQLPSMAQYMRCATSSSAALTNSKTLTVLLHDMTRQP